MVMVDFWHTANLAFSDKERQAFNKWKCEMYEASEKAVSAVNHLPDEDRFSYVAQKARAMHDKVCAIPALMK
jgi:hypothetical protein